MHISPISGFGWRAIQVLIVLAVAWANIYWKISDNVYLVSGAAFGLAWLVTFWSERLLTFLGLITPAWRSYRNAKWGAMCPGHDPRRRQLTQRRSNRHPSYPPEHVSGLRIRKDVRDLMEVATYLPPADGVVGEVPPFTGSKTVLDHGSYRPALGNPVKFPLVKRGQ
jgi:hypothetical protein